MGRRVLDRQPIRRLLPIGALLLLPGLSACERPASASTSESGARSERATAPSTPSTGHKDTAHAGISAPANDGTADANPPEPAGEADEPAARPTSAVAADPLAPLTEAQRERLATAPADEAQPVEIHYVQSNETRHDLFFPFIEGRGGALIGVGSDQSLTLAAVSRSTFVVLVDIDQRVIDLHALYAVLIPRASDATNLVEAFAAQHREATEATLEAAFAERPAAERRRLLREYRASRETVHRHLLRVLDRTVDGEPASWLSSAEHFDHVQRLYRAGRVHAMVGDLTGPRTMHSVGAIMDELDLRVGTLYLSNAEEYFRYTSRFVDNIAGLPRADDAMVLRTIYAKSWEHADLWAYQVQSLSDFVERLQQRRGRSRKGMFRQAEAEGAIDRAPGPRGLSRLGRSTQRPSVR